MVDGVAWTDDHRRIFNGGDDLQGAAAVGAVLHVDVEDPFEQPGPTASALPHGG